MPVVDVQCEVHKGHLDWVGRLTEVDLHVPDLHLQLPLVNSDGIEDLLIEIPSSLFISGLDIQGGDGFNPRYGLHLPYSGMGTVE